MNTYEITFLVNDKKAADTFKKAVTALKGKITNDEYIGERLLAYPIGKEAKAHYYSINVDMPHEALDELKKKMQLEPIVMRYLVLKTEEEEKEEKAK
ncbi:30S ribosomal protein S6 [Candidatus Woesebacteria bacterium]|nr:30S ribosomal protein S6 [Candidatus Woesebacteria bacterium]